MSKYSHFHSISPEIQSVFIQKPKSNIQAQRRNLSDNWGGVYSCYARRISFEINSNSKEIHRAEHEYMNKHPPPKLAFLLRPCPSHVKTIFHSRQNQLNFLNYSSLLICRPVIIKHCVATFAEQTITSETCIAVTVERSRVVYTGGISVTLSC